MTRDQPHEARAYRRILLATTKIKQMTKIWNAGWAMKELGWA
jgi:hypothetical protein